MRSLTVAILLSALISLSTQADDTSSTTTMLADSTQTTTNASTMTTKTYNDATTKASDSTSVTSNTTIGTTKPAATYAPTSASTSPPSPPGNLRPVGNDCLQIYFKCTEKSADFKNGNFCTAFNDNKACLNSTKNCTSDDLDRIKYVDCGPDEFGTEGTVSAHCQARITECLSLSVKPDSIPTKDAPSFKTFFCTNKNKNETCFTSSDGSSMVFKCTADEFEDAEKMAHCTAAHTVISSAVFICLAVFTQRLFHRC